MRVFLDTNVLVAAFVEAHSFHSRAIPVLARIVNDRDKGFISAHTILELHSALTQLPQGLAMPPALVLQIFNANVLPYFKCIPLSARDYQKVQNNAAIRGIVGGQIYDLLHLKCAEIAKADRIVTFNVTDFQTLATEGQRALIYAP